MNPLRDRFGRPAPLLLRALTLLALCGLALQLAFLGRIALLVVVDPQSTTFQRSEAWRLLVQTRRLAWSQEWVDYDRISPHPKRAVIASEDASFADHAGIEYVYRVCSFLPLIGLLTVFLPDLRKPRAA